VGKSLSWSELKNVAFHRLRRTLIPTIARLRAMTAARSPRATQRSSENQ